MNMLASVVNNDMRLLNLQSKPIPKPKNQAKANFAKVLNANSKPKEQVSNNIMKNKDTQIAEVKNDTKIKILDDFLTMNKEKLEIPAEVSQAELEAIISFIMEEIGISDVGELGAEGIAYLNAELAQMFSPNNNQTNIEVTNEENSKLSTNLVNKEPILAVVKENGEEKQVANRVVSSSISDSLEAATKRNTTDKPQNQGTNMNSVDKVSKEDNPSQTDVKKLINTEVSKLNNLKTSASTTMNNQVTTEQTATNTGEDDKGVNLNPNKPELNNTRTDNRIVLVDNKPVEVKEIIDQIVRKAELVLRQNASEIKINLKPEFLGKMTIKIAVEQGIVTARFLTENMQVKHLLESNLNTLRQALENQGIRVERTEVNVQLNNGGMFDGSEKHQEWEHENSGLANYLPNGERENNHITYAELDGELNQLENGTANIDYYQELEDTTLSFLI